MKFAISRKNLDSLTTLHCCMVDDIEKAVRNWSENATIKATLKEGDTQIKFETGNELIIVEVKDGRTDNSENP